MQVTEKVVIMGENTGCSMSSTTGTVYTERIGVFLSTPNNHPILLQEWFKKSKSQGVPHSDVDWHLKNPIKADILHTTDPDLLSAQSPNMFLCLPHDAHAVIIGS